MRWRVDPSSGCTEALTKDLDSSSANDYKKGVGLGLLYKVRAALLIVTPTCD